MKVSIYSREMIERLLTKGFPQNVAIISFLDPPMKGVDRDMQEPVDYCGKARCMFQVLAYDIHYDELTDYGMEYEDYFTEAEELAEFIMNVQTEGLDIICQCEYGQGRSAGCAAAILEFFYGKGISIFTDYRYCPNQMVFHKLYDALKKYCNYK